MPRPGACIRDTVAAMEGNWMLGAAALLVVGAAAALVERTRVAFAALVLGSAAPIVTVAWISLSPPTG